MKKVFLTLGFVAFILVAVNLGSCKKDKTTTSTNNTTVSADTCAAVTYTKDISPVITGSCISCHSASNAQGGIQLETYDQVKTQTSSGKLLAAINHQAGASAMPQGTSKLPSATLAKFDCWKNNGYKQ